MADQTYREAQRRYAQDAGEHTLLALDRHARRHGVVSIPRREAYQRLVTLLSDRARRVRPRALSATWGEQMDDFINDFGIDASVSLVQSMVEETYQTAKRHVRKMMNKTQRRTQQRQKAKRKAKQRSRRRNRG